MQGRDRPLVTGHTPVDDGFSFGELVDLLRDSWLVVLVCSILGGGAAITLALLSPPYYQATALIVPTGSDDSASGALSRLAGQIAPLAGLVQGASTAGSDGREAWVATLRSRQLAEQFIARHNLAPALFPEYWDASSERWRQKNGKSLQPSSGEVFRHFSKNVLKVSEDRRTGLITVAVEARDPVMAADWANGLVADVNELIRQRAIDESRKSLEYLEKEIASTNVAELQKILYGMVESRVAKAVLANVRKEYAFSVIDAAVPSDVSDFVRPRRIVYALVGLLAGGVVGLLFGVARWARRQARLQPA